jgi:beta-lactamase class A
MLNLVKENENLAKQIQAEENRHYELISPSVAWLSAEEFLNKQKTFRISYTEIKAPLNLTMTQGVKGKFGLYFEDLSTGAWLGINEKEKFIPLSLLKVPLLVAVLKKVEEGDVSLDEKVTLSENDLDTRSGTLASKGVGYQTTVRELLQIMIRKSDNTAMKTLANHYTNFEDSLAALSALGLPQPTSEKVEVSPKEYSNIFRALYVSNYLSRPMSELALSLMLETDFNTQLPASLPKDIKVSHKVGFDINEGYYHDCGIVYASTRPYMICIMSKNTTQEEADKVISTLSKKIYDFVEKDKR